MAEYTVISQEVTLLAGQSSNDSMVKQAVAPTLSFPNQKREEGRKHSQNPEVPEEDLSDERFKLNFSGCLLVENITTPLSTKTI